MNKDEMINIYTEAVREYQEAVTASTSAKKNVSMATENLYRAQLDAEKSEDYAKLTNDASRKAFVKNATIEVTEDLYVCERELLDCEAAEKICWLDLQLANAIIRATEIEARYGYDDSTNGA